MKKKISLAVVSALLLFSCSQKEERDPGAVWWDKHGQESLDKIHRIGQESDLPLRVTCSLLAEAVLEIEETPQPPTEILESLWDEWMTTVSEGILFCLEGVELGRGDYLDISVEKFNEASNVMLVIRQLTGQV